MTKQELAVYLDAGRPVDVCVEELVKPAGFVKRVRILPNSPHSDYVVTIEYELARLYVSQDYEGAHLKYRKEYPKLDAAIRDLENYLGKTVEHWANYTAYPLQVKTQEVGDERAANSHFEALRCRGDLILDNGSIFELSTPIEYDPEHDEDLEALNEYLKRERPI